MVADIASEPVDEHECTPSERKKTRRYQFELGGAGVVYALLILLSVHQVDVSSGAARVAYALVPMIGILGMSAAIVRYALSADEFVRQTIVISAAIAALVSAVVTMAVGFLQEAGFPLVPMTAVWPLLVIVFGVAIPFVRRRYR
jgi:hypothetical protein